MSDTRRVPRNQAILASIGCLLAGLQACASDIEARERSPQDRTAPQLTVVDEATLEAVSSAPAARTASVAELGEARMLISAEGANMHLPLRYRISGQDAARAHLMRYREELGLSTQAVEALELRAEDELRADAAIYTFVQRVQGLPVFQARAKLVLDGQKNLVSLANTLVPSWVSDAPKGTFRLTREHAIAKAYVAASGAELLADAVSDLRDGRGDWRDFALVTPAELPRVLDASTRQVMYADEDQLVAAFHVELTLRDPDTRESQAYGMVIHAEDGRVLWKTSLTANEAFTYRVFADASAKHVPMDGPIVDATPHPTGVPDSFQPAWAEPTLVQMSGFNKPGDPWLDPAATFTFGNNARAYSDRNQTNQGITSSGSGFNAMSDFRAETTAARTFDRIYDPKLSPSATPDQIKASVTQAFYVTNWLHDWFYDSGFDEKAGNAQVSNLGRGGAENDPLLIEAQDSADNGASNNANMSTPADGRSPRMQMYVWTGTPNRALTTVPALALEDWLGGAGFGPKTFDLSSGELVLANDGSTAAPAGSTGTGMPTLTDGCQQPTNVRGKIAVIDRGICTFVVKVQNAQAAGAVGVLIVNHVPGHTAPNAPTNAQGITVPVLLLSYEDGLKLKSLLKEGPVQATKFSRGAEIGRDGSIDSTVVTHEWGHYIHMRLQTGSSSQFGGMSEGWGDFNALLMMVREGDKFAGRAYPMAQYAAAGFGARSAYFGIRRAPYSVEYTMNPFTFTHVRANAPLPTAAPILAADDDPMNEAHFVGEIWAQMLFEVYVGIIEAGNAAGRPFDESKRRMTDYMVAALKAAPDDPTFVEQRDAMLSAVRAMAKMDPTRQADVEAVARGFAKRGLGQGAVAPPKRSRNLNEAVESFVIPTL